MKKAFSIILILLITVCMLTSCAKDTSDNSEKPDELTLMYYGVDDDLELIAHAFEEESGVKVNLIHYEQDDVSEVETKLMAGDKDIDLFYTQSVNIASVLRAEAFVDLYEHDEIKARIESNEFAKYMSVHDGRCIGIPMKGSYLSATECINPSMESLFGYTEQAKEYHSHGNLKIKYRQKNVDAINGKYLDPDGDELFKVLQWLYHHPDDPAQNDIYPEDSQELGAEYLIINKASKNKDLAVQLCAYAFDLISGAKTSEHGKPMHYYPEIDGIESIPIGWKSKPTENITMPTAEQISATGGDEEALKKLAQDTARQIAKIIYG